MPLDKHILLEFLEVLEEEISREITIVAVGGTAMTLLDLKPSTIDIDFTIPSNNLQEFQKAINNVSHGFKIDIWPDGMIFSQFLPEDYLDKSIEIKTKLKHICLKALHPIDIVATKIGRLNNRDLQDIKTCIQKFNLSRNQIKQRAKQIEYVGRKENYTNNLQYVLKKYF